MATTTSTTASPFKKSNLKKPKSTSSSSPSSLSENKTNGDGKVQTKFNDLPDYLIGSKEVSRSADVDESDDVCKSENYASRSDYLKRSGYERIRFDPLVILLDASLQGELDVVKDIVEKYGHKRMVNDEGITALHNSICAGHLHIVQYLVNSGCEVNAPDIDLWTPLHCAASCNNLKVCRLLVEHGACLFATTDSDKCVMKKMKTSGHELRAAFTYEPEETDELAFEAGDSIITIDPNPSKSKKNDRDNDDEEEEEDGDDGDENWWLCKNLRTSKVGLVPRNYLCLA
ncbi:hypothetical protein HELRODRAFT_187621 [Helobdella robusta]|uniref:SH3 domain-containing protein n=1 Tax=Helobdella robusta TaxID=6412 RepID=T1FPB3_HELRO|nr:hypothetical protein HELRODRAFT_187621 [Helobdella robusta]ESN91005.1 hypothetical protein HELRODRAFT_187621 [Helobdella robusta]